MLTFEKRAVSLSDMNCILFRNFIYFVNELWYLPKILKGIYKGIRHIIAIICSIVYYRLYTAIKFEFIIIIQTNS